MTLLELEDYFERTSHDGALVLGPQGELLGLITQGELEQAMVHSGPEATVEDIYSRHPLSVQENDTLEEVIKRAGMLELEYVPVVSADRSRRPLGVLSRLDIIRAYAEAISGRDRRFVSLERRRAENVFGLRPIEVILEEGDPAIGKTLRDVSPPPEAVVISIIRKGAVLVPRGDTILKEGDHITGLALAGTTSLLVESLKGQAT